MKSFIYIFAILAVFSSCNNHDAKKNDFSAMEKDTANFTNIKWVDSVVNIGTVTAGKKAEIKFRFKNTGTKPLFIINAEPGCGCTVADYPKNAIAPNSGGLITAAYDAPGGTTGEFRKNIHVTANTAGSTSHYIFFYGVIKAEGDTTTGKVDTAKLNAIKTKELKRNVLLKPSKN